jgi:hypothetical protein
MAAADEGDDKGAVQIAVTEAPQYRLYKQRFLGLGGFVSLWLYFLRNFSPQSFM